MAIQPPLCLALAADRQSVGRTMARHVTIRPERKSDWAAIGSTITNAFRGMPYADGDEAQLVDQLRNEDALTLSLVAESRDIVVGHIAFSPARLTDGSGSWYSLGPLAVLPRYQRTGIGSELVRAGLRAISQLGADGCILTGDPAFYSRFEFEVSPSNAPEGEPPENFMIKLIGGDRPSGPILFHGAFNGAA